MENLVLSPIDPAKLVNDIAEKVTANLLANSTKTAPPPQEDPLNDFIPKIEVRGKFASSATLWKMEKAGKLKSYGFGGKRYYKRSELLEVFEPLKTRYHDKA